MFQPPRNSIWILSVSLWLLLWSGQAIAAAEGRAHALRLVEVSPAIEGAVVELWADGVIESLEHFTVEDPARVVLDFPGLANHLGLDRVAVGGERVAQVRVGLHRDRVRIVVDVTPDSLRSARIVRGEQGVALLLGDVPNPDMARSNPVRDLPTPQVAVSAPPKARVTPRREGAAQDLSVAAQQLAAAARELSAAARELKGTRIAAAPAVPVAIETAETIERAAEAIAAESETTASNTQSTPEAPPQPEQMAAALPAVEAKPPLDDGAAADAVAPPAGGYAHDYTGVTQWLEDNRNTAPRFAEGDVIDQGRLEELRPFLAPGYFEEFNFPELEVTIQPLESHAPHVSYQQATDRYEGQARIDNDGSIVDYTAGRPFSDERIHSANELQAGFMVGWNNIYRWQHYGYRAEPIPMVYLSEGEPKGRVGTTAAVLKGGGQVERSVTMEYQRVYLSHQAALADQDYRVKVTDAKDQHFKDWMQFTEPFDMRGMAFVFERFRDPREPDQVNSYLPTERRIRRLSAKERSDSFVGSEMTMDDFEGFSGRMLDYTWAYRGEKHVLHVPNSAQPHSVFVGPQSHIPHDRWQLRRCHVVETKPIYDGHPYGRKLTFYDAETYNIAATVIFDHDDRVLKIVSTIYHWPGGDPTGPEGDTVPHYRSTTAVNIQNGRSMVAWSEGTVIPDMKASEVRRLFNVSSLTGGR